MILNHWHGSAQKAVSGVPEVPGISSTGARAYAAVAVLAPLEDIVELIAERYPLMVRGLSPFS